MSLTSGSVHERPVEEPSVARTLLEQLGIPTEPPPEPRARDPASLLGEDTEAPELAS
jgi:hypothetical protein